MNTKLIDNYNKAKSSRQKAKEWQDLPNCERYTKDHKFEISLAHCDPPGLTRAGQRYAGDNNYWKTESDFNKAILKYLVENWEDIYPSVLKKLKQKEQEAIQDCQSFIDDMQNMINESIS